MFLYMGGGVNCMYRLDRNRFGKWNIRRRGSSNVGMLNLNLCNKETNRGER